MARRKETETEVEEIKKEDLSSGPDQSVLFLKANRPLTVQEHEELSRKLRYEEENTEIKIVLVPFSLDIVDGEAK